MAVGIFLLVQCWSLHFGLDPAHAQVRQTESVLCGSWQPYMIGCAMAAAYEYGLVFCNQSLHLGFGGHQSLVDQLLPTEACCDNDLRFDVPSDLSLQMRPSASAGSFFPP